MFFHDYDDNALHTFEECAEICVAVGTSVCRYFVHMSGSLGHCTNPYNATVLPWCDQACLDANTAGQPLKAKCLYYSYYSGYAYPTETLAQKVNCAYNTARHGFITDSTQGALPLIPSNYLELTGSTTESYGSAATLLTYDGLHGVIHAGNNAMTTTFQQCAETCMTIPNKECRYFILLTPSDGTSAYCSNTDTTKSEPNGPCLLYGGGNGTASGQTVTQTITESMQALSAYWNNVSNVVCNPGQYRHVKMNINSYGTYPVDSNGITYGAVGGCGFGTDCSDCGPRVVGTHSIAVDAPLPPPPPGSQTTNESGLAGSPERRRAQQLDPEIVQLLQANSPPPPTPPSPPPPNPPPKLPPPLPPPSPSPPPAPYAPDPCATSNSRLEPDQPLDQHERAPDRQPQQHHAE